MPLVLPDEIVVERVLPSLRIRLARELAARDLTQQEIADHLGVTQAAVSTYVSGEVQVEEVIDQHPRTHTVLERVADGLATEEMDSYDALGEILSLLREFEDRGPICELHEEAMPGLHGLGCDLCVRGPDERVAAERDVLAGVRKATRILATTPGMADAIPNVGTNVGYALPDATDETDVAAIPGRIYAVRGRVEVPANPEFGASAHVATVILAAMGTDQSARGALNLATTEPLLEVARDEGIDPVEFDPAYEDRADRIRERFAEREHVPRVLYHSGAFGIEPITYVLGETAEAAARRAATLVEASEGH